MTQREEEGAPGGDQPSTWERHERVMTEEELQSQILEDLGHLLTLTVELGQDAGRLRSGLDVLEANPSATAMLRLRALLQDVEGHIERIRQGLDDVQRFARLLFGEQP